MKSVMKIRWNQLITTGASLIGLLATGYLVFNWATKVEYRMEYFAEKLVAVEVHIDKQGEQIDRQGQRTDQLYKVIIDILKEKK